MAKQNKNSKAKAGKLAKQEKALEHRIAGLSYRAIATKMGCSRTQAHTYVTEGLKESTSRIAKSADDLRDLELERLDTLIKGLYPKAKKGDPQAVDKILKVMEQRQKLTGIQAAPQVLGEIIAEAGAADKPSLRVRVTYVKPE